MLDFIVTVAGYIIGFLCLVGALTITAVIVRIIAIDIKKIKEEMKK